ncbi:MAG: hypothetical protein IJF84_11880 [Thermoguttaceae bacterium]|nr:hypothetical protein [Thermoguttaceae bacterium]
MISIAQFKRITLAALAVAVLTASALAQEPARKKAELDWLTIDYPEKAVPGQKFEVYVTPKKIPAGRLIGGDIHHAKPGQYIGYAAWGGAPQPAQEGKTLTFRYTMPPYKSDDQGVQPIYYLTTKGWDEAELRAYNGPIILPLVNAEIKSTFRPDTATLKKSWIVVGKAQSEDGGEPVWKEGETVVVPFEYYVDKSDDWGGTEIVLWVVGPWVDCPDGKYTDHRTHHNYHGVGAPNFKCEIGKRAKGSWTFKLPKPYAAAEPEKGKYGDSLLLIAQFRGHDDKNWPWSIRHGLPGFARANGWFELDATTPGNLFTYDQKVVMQATPLNKAEGMKPAKLNWTVTNVKGKTVAQGAVDFPDPSGKPTSIPINIDEKGTFLLRAELPGAEAREVTFARIPDLKKTIGNGPTPFGGQKFFGSEEAAKANRMLGLSSCRAWINWGSLEPARGQYNEAAWKSLRNSIDVCNKNGIRPWLLIDGIPIWAIQSEKSYGKAFSAMPLDEKDVRRFITRLATEFKNDIIGFEWQNEIVPGDTCADPVADYAMLCRVGAEAAKRVNPKLRNQLAGGLWPQTFRQNLLAAGVGEYIDILPVHYGTGSSVRGAKRDLAAVGCADKVAVWDNETALGGTQSTWGMPLSEAMKNTAQGDYYFSHFPDELLAGCEHIVLFGGEGAAAGDWSHFWGDMSPRPGAAALAVLINAIGNAKPIGEISLGKSDSLKLFEKPDGTPVLIVSTNEKDGETVTLPNGFNPKAMVDQQGNETPLPQSGVTKLSLTSSPYIVVGGDIQAIKAALILSFPGSEAAVPTVSGIADKELEVPVRLSNLLKKPILVNVRLDKNVAPDGGKGVTVSLKPGETVTQLLKIDSVPNGATPTTVTLRYADAASKTLQGTFVRKVVVNAVNPDQIGNLLLNPGFEQAAGDPAAAAEWGGTGKQGVRTEFNNPNEPGHGKYVIRFEKTHGAYYNMYQNLPKIPVSGGEYIYSFWIKSENLATGSNFGGSTANGQSWNRHWLQVFQAPNTQDCWQVFSKRLEIPDGTTRVSAAPVCRGDGWSMIDNAILVPYEGSDYVAFAPQVKSGEKRTIDGDLSDFDQSAPIPLLGRNQVRTVNKAYKWTPDNCSGVVYLNYDEQFLYVGIEVIDDKHHEKSDAKGVAGDTVRIGIHPLNRLPGEDGKAFCFDVSPASPGGGSGKHSLYRPAEFSGGLKSGQLTKDSSEYDIAVTQKGNKTTYEIAMPWSDLGGAKGTLGTKLGLSLRLTDADSSDAPEAYLLWGEGLTPVWNPQSFGILTLTK